MHIVVDGVCYIFIFISKVVTLTEFTKLLLLSETHRRPTCLIGDPSDTSLCFIWDLDMLYRRPRQASSETSTVTCFIRYLNILYRWPWHTSSETSTCFSGDLDILHWRPQHASSKIHLRPTCLIGDQHVWTETDIPA